MNPLRVLRIAVLCLAVAGSASASWYDDYDAGVKAARAGNWNVVVDKMTKAIAGSGNESNKARTYGAIFINYHPYYYRGVALSNLGQYQQAINDFEKTAGPGEFDMGSLDTLIKDAKRKLDESNTPTPPPPPVMDPALRRRAEGAVASARNRVDAAVQRRATGAPQYASAIRELEDANRSLVSARSNEDLQAVIASAEKASDLANGAQPPPPPPPVPVPAPVGGGGGTPPVPVGGGGSTGGSTGGGGRISGAGDEALKAARVKLNRALVKYFNGDFDLAIPDFRDLTVEMPRNGWIWAFLGASEYSVYAFEADPSFRVRALESFRQARNYGFKNPPARYFSKKIIRAFNDGT